VHYGKKKCAEENPQSGIKILDCIVLNNAPENKFLNESGTNHYDYDRSEKRPEGKLFYQRIGLQDEILNAAKRYAGAANCKLQWQLSQFEDKPDILFV